MDFIPFALPEIGQEEIDEVVDSLKSGWLSTGPKTKQFEAEFSAFMGNDVESVSVNSATAGLHLTLEAIGLAADDEVIVPALTFTATAEVVRYFNAHPVIVDVDPSTLNIDPIEIEKAITPKTKAIIPVHFAGLPCDMENILSIAKANNLKVIEDAAHSFPAFDHGNIIGSLYSDATVFSFYVTKTIATGEGGMIVTRNPEIAKRCKIMRLHGISRDAFDRYTSKDSSWYYEVVAPGFKYNLSDISSSIGIHQLRKANRFLERRRAIASQYRSRFAGLPISLPPGDSAHQRHAYHLFVINLKKEAGCSREEFIKRMKEKGVACSVHFIPLHIHPYWRDAYSYSEDDFPHSMSYYRTAVSLPIYTKLSDEQVEHIISSVKASLS